VKNLAELSPADWLPLASAGRRRVTSEDSDIGTIVSGATDKLFSCPRQSPVSVAPGFRSDIPLGSSPCRLKLYNSVLEYRHQRVVVSLPVLLSPAADSPK